MNERNMPAEPGGYPSSKWRLNEGTGGLTDVMPRLLIDDMNLMVKPAAVGALRTRSAKRNCGYSASGASHDSFVYVRHVFSHSSPGETLSDPFGRKVSQLFS